MITIEKIMWDGLHCIIPVNELRNLNDEIDYKNIFLYKKPEFHTTIMGNRWAEKIRKNCTEQQTQNLKDYINSFNFNFTLTNNMYFLKKDYGDHTRYSKIIELEMKDQGVFEQGCSNIIGFEYKLFPHITTHSNATNIEMKNTGIGILSRDELEDIIWKE